MRLSTMDSVQTRSLLLAPLNGTFTKRFWSKVNKTDACWFWTGALTEHGYGKVEVCEARGVYKVRRAHRIAYELETGIRLSSEIGVLHSCDTPACVRPSHLFLGDQKANMFDAKTKGRLRGKTKIFGRKMWACSVRALREMVAREKTPIDELCRALGLNRSSVTGILTGRLWPSAGGPLRPQRPRITSETKARLRDGHAAGQTAQELVRATNVSESQVRRILYGDARILGGDRKRGPRGSFVKST